MKYRKLTDCCEFISDGDHLPPPKSTDGIPLLQYQILREKTKYHLKIQCLFQKVIMIS